MKKLLLRTFSTAVILFALLVGLRVFYGYTSAYTLWSTVMPTPGASVPLQYGLSFTNNVSTTGTVSGNYVTGNTISSGTTHTVWSLNTNSSKYCQVVSSSCTTIPQNNNLNITITVPSGYTNVSYWVTGYTASGCSTLDATTEKVFVANVTGVNGAWVYNEDSVTHYVELNEMLCPN